MLLPFGDELKNASQRAAQGQAIHSHHQKRALQVPKYCWHRNIPAIERGRIWRTWCSICLPCKAWQISLPRSFPLREVSHKLKCHINYKCEPSKTFSSLFATSGMALKIFRAAELVRGAALLVRKLWFLVPRFTATACRFVTGFLIPVADCESGKETCLTGVADADAFSRCGLLFGDLVDAFFSELSWRRAGDCIRLKFVSDAAKIFYFQWAKRSNFLKSAAAGEFPRIRVAPRPQCASAHCARFVRHPHATHAHHHHHPRNSEIGKSKSQKWSEKWEWVSVFSREKRTAFYIYIFISLFSRGYWVWAVRENVCLYDLMMNPWWTTQLQAHAWNSSFPQSCPVGKRGPKCVQSAEIRKRADF